ncbi:hypothetical protein AR454_00885 [Bacillus mycoides]|uniref:hypothetical protein n=1 Tax=Bacillus mycoides TaxID=1405 RepID=UPI001E4112F0|nr:hypothetical protein [Bacillus mycoides]MCD4642139.1 hypothetical protein [Bacillus mycoides]
MSKCKDKDSIIFFQAVNFLLRADSICPPKCFNIAGLGRALSACGPGVFIAGGTFYEGIVSVVLVERPGALDLISLSFNGINNAGGTVVLLAPFNVPDANLSITDCKANGCSCNQNGAFPMPFGDSFINPSEIVNKAVIIHLDGTVEEIQF